MEKLLQPAFHYKHKHLTETELVQALQAGDERALAMLYDRYSGALYHIVCRIVRQEALAEDVLQDAFVKIWLHFADYQPDKGRLFTWLLNVTRNLAIDRLRSASYRQCQLAQSLEEDLGYQALLTYQPELKSLEVLLVQLKAEDRLLIDLIYFQGYTGQEVATQLAIPLGTLKTRLRTALIKLRKHFHPGDF